MRTYLRWLLAVSLATAASVSRPTLGDEIADARRAFVSGMKHFDLGEYDQALADFKDGYRAKEDPVFLYNIAQCYRLKKENREAIRYYRLYLSRAPEASNRTEIESRIVKLQEQVDTEDRARRTAATEPHAEAPQATTQPQSTAPSDLTAAAPQRKPTPVYKKWWLWTVVGVVAVGAGVGLGVGLTRGTSSVGTTFPTAGF